MSNAPTKAQPKPTPGICGTCGNWTRGEYVDVIETGSGGGAIIVTHGVGVCPGKRR